MLVEMATSLGISSNAFLCARESNSYSNYRLSKYEGDVGGFRRRGVVIRNYKLKDKLLGEQRAREEKNRAEQRARERATGETLPEFSEDIGRVCCEQEEKTAKAAPKKPKSIPLRNVGEAVAKEAVGKIKDAVINYNIQTKKWPSDLTVLITVSGDEAPVLEGGEGALVDPWGKQYIMERSGKRIVIISAGPDGEFGNDDDVRSDRIRKLKDKGDTGVLSEKK